MMDNNGYLKFKAYVNDYGYDFVMSSIEKAVKERIAEEMLLDSLVRDHSPMNLKAARIYKKAKEMGVRLL